ncbi:hypothetical protein HDU96_002466 [Phlyctochytrium bullatum]|nr:hypothetical protein HDU96_002466 [Phlyctochytrium bullatum]
MTERGTRPSATTNASFTRPHPPATVGIASLPPELALRIVQLLHPADVVALTAAGQCMRRLFRPADTEFAMVHLLARFPGLRVLYGAEEGRKKETEQAQDSEDKESLYQQLRREVPFRHLPICYSLAVLKLDNFSFGSFSTISDGGFDGEALRLLSRTDEPVNGQVAAWLQKLLVVGSLAVFFDSAEAARRITEIEQTSIEMLPLDVVERASRLGKERHILPKITDDPDISFSKSLRRFALAACTVGAVSVLRFLLESYPASFANMAEHQSESDGSTYLQRAFRRNHPNVVRVLAEFMNRPPYRGEEIAGRPSPVNGSADLCFLAEATNQGNEEMIRAILESGADPNFVSQEPRRRVPPSALYAAWFTALMACRTAKLAKRLLKAVELKAPHTKANLLAAQCRYNNNAMHRALEQKNPKIFKVLLHAIERTGSKMDDGGRALKNQIFGARGFNRRTPIYHACGFNDKIAMVVLGIMFDGVDPTTVKAMTKVMLTHNGDNRTAFHVAAEGLCKRVLAVSADDGGTPLHLVVRKRSLQCVRMLLKYGADPGGKDEAGNTPMMIAQEVYSLDIGLELREAILAAPKEATSSAATR